MFPDLARALAVAILVGVAPGWFWARCLCPPAPHADLAERIAYATALSVTLVPTAALVQIGLFDTGVTLPIAAASAAIVFVAGIAAYVVFGPAEEIGGPVLLARRPSDGGRWASVSAGLVPPLLLVVLGVVAVRGYLGPVLHDWPFIRGGDQYSHAVMTRLMLSEGSVEAWLVYPPGFHTTSAVVSRLSGLSPLELFPLVGPALTVLTPLACYVLAKGLGGRGCGLAAAFFSGLLVVGPYESLAEARYPNLVSADFLIVLAVAALTRVYHAPSWRAGLLFALLGSSVVLYHQVASLYLFLLLALVSLALLPYLFLRDRARALGLLASLALALAISVAYAWDTYDLPGLISGLAGGSGGGSGGQAISNAIGTQEPLSLGHLAETTSPPVLALGLAGAVLLAAGSPGDSAGGRGKDRDPPLLLTRATLLAWTLLLFVGSRTSLSGFPQRFERDLGPPLSVLAALALVALLRPLGPRSSASLPAKVVAGLVAVLAVAFCGLQAAENLRAADARSPNVISPPVAAAGEWLAENGAGENIVVTPYLNDHVPGSAMLAMGGYTGLRSYTPERLRTPRALPTSGKRPLLDARWAMLHPAGERTASVLERYDVGYVVLYKRSPGVPWRSFKARPDLYDRPFENAAVVVFAPRDRSPSGQPSG